LPTGRLDPRRSSGSNRAPIAPQAERPGPGSYF
jgi:hypothetical protein